MAAGSRNSWLVVLCAGIVAGVVATLVQVLLWLVFTDDSMALLLRDARLTAALVLGQGVLPPLGFDAGIMLTATLIHFALSIIYAALLAPLAARLTLIPSLLAGAGFGGALYVVNLYGFTAIFPWFAQARGWITLVAHLGFGLSVMAVYRCGINGVRFRPGAH
jgi:hypothetical protein